MAEIVSTGQRLVTGAKNPGSVYSRWVGFCFPVPSPGPAFQWDVTEALGQNLWLLEVKLIITAATAAGLVDCNWRIVTCTVPPVGPGQIATVLEPVVAVRWLNKPYAHYVGSDREFCFHMNRLYTGASRRFAVWVQNNSATVKLEVMACFLISEG